MSIPVSQFTPHPLSALVFLCLFLSVSLFLSFEAMWIDLDTVTQTKVRKWNTNTAYYWIYMESEKIGIDDLIYKANKALTYLQVHSRSVCSLNKYPEKDPYYPLYLMPLSIWAPGMSSHHPHSSNLCPPDHIPPALEDLAQAPIPAWSLLPCPHPPTYYTCTECCVHFITALNFTMLRVTYLQILSPN